ncbi:amidohydrolase family protein [Marinifilum fragile]|uniref:amidohydrolase family protein n=1 Tax=Marinifilum fragile TaxID=570161 RepID=UPI002AA81F9C|nr:amidohydrolase family protein [Marinifilum fragile]
MKQISLCLLLCTLFIFPSRSEKYDIIIQNVSIVDVETGSIVKNKDVGIQQQVIKKITTGNQLSANHSTQVIDGNGKYLIPGLWDMHVHFYFPDKEYLKMYLAKGVVGVREMTGYRMEWQDSTEQNSNVPRIMFSSQIIDGPTPWFENEIPVKSCKQAMQIVQEAEKSKSEFIKLLSLVPRDQYMAIANECNRLNFEFAGHVPYSIGLIEAASLGQKSNEHLNGLLLSCSKQEKFLHARLDSLLGVASKEEKLSRIIKMQIMGCTTKALWSFDQTKADSVIHELSKYNMYQCPTLGVKHRFQYNELDWVYTDNRYDFFPPPVQKRYRPDAEKLKKMKPFERELKLQEKLLYQMQREGIKIIAGSDQGCAGFNLHDELEYFVNAGFSNTEALQAATINAATYMHKEKRMGSVDENKLADLVLLNANPLENIQNTRDIELVIFKNTIIYPDQLLEEVKEVNLKISNIDPFEKKFD